MDNNEIILLGNENTEEGRLVNARNEILAYLKSKGFIHFTSDLAFYKMTEEIDSILGKLR